MSKQADELLGEEINWGDVYFSVIEKQFTVRNEETG